MMVISLIVTEKQKMSNEFEIPVTEDAFEYTVKHNGSELRGSISFLNERGVPEENIIASIKEVAYSTIKSQHASAIKHLTGDTTEEERDTWYDQRAAAKAFLSNKASDDEKEMLNDLLIPGETKTALSTSIMVKNKLMLKLIGKAGGVKRRAEHSVSNASSAEEISQAMVTAATESETAVAEYMQAVAELKAAG